MSNNNILIIKKTILLIGETGTGKSTICNNLSKNNVQKTSNNPSPCTSTITKWKYIYNVYEKNYNINVIDTIGFSDIIVDNSKIFSDIRNYMINETRHIDYIVLCLTKERVRRTSIDLLMNFLCSIKIPKENIILCLTKADLNITPKNEYIDDLKSVAFNLIDKCGIHVEVKIPIAK